MAENSRVFISLNNLEMYHEKLMEQEYVNKAVNDLTNYYLKTETYTRDEITNLISAIKQFNVLYVTELPTENIDKSTIYFVPNGTSSTVDKCNEYMYLSSISSYSVVSENVTPEYSITNTTSGETINNAVYNTNAIQIKLYKNGSLVTSKQVSLSGYKCEISYYYVIGAKVYVAYTRTKISTGVKDTTTYTQSLDFSSSMTAWSSSDTYNLNKWELVGTTDIDLSDYYTKAAIDAKDRIHSHLLADGTQIVASSDLNTIAFLSIGRYVCSTDVIASGLTNCPTTKNFIMEVINPKDSTIDDESSSVYKYRLRKIIDNEGNIYIQYAKSTTVAGTFTFSAWKALGDSDLTNYYTKAQVDTLLGNKADQSTTYTKLEVNQLIANEVSITDLISSIPSDAEINALWD